MPATPAEIDQVRDALQNPQYTWRTLKGVAKETNLTLKTVKEAVRALGAAVRKSEVPSDLGDDLYTTQARYEQLKPEPADREKVIAALQDPKYNWRTVSGVVAATGLSAETVVDVLNTNDDVIIQSEIPSTQGEDLYTTRAHYLAKSGPVSKMLGFFRGRLS